MATQLFAPPYSFVQLSDPENNGCTEVDARALPLSSLQNLSCQFFVKTPATPPEGCLMQYIMVPLKEVSQPCLGVGGSGTSLSQVLPGIQADLESTSYPGYDKVLDFGTFVNDFDAYAGTGYLVTKGVCFRFVIYEMTYDIEKAAQTHYSVLACTSLFIRNEDDCFNAKVQYFNVGNNAFGFEYVSLLGGYYNKLELPLFLRNPQNPTDESSYKKSDGSWLKVYSRTDQEWMLETASMGADFHQKLAIALNHDNVKINSGYANEIIPNIQNESGFIEVVLSEKYEVDWPDVVPTYALAKGKAKVKNAQPVSMINNNC